MSFSVIDWTAAGAIRFLDQTRLPTEEVYREVQSVETMVEAIQSLRVRGAPLIGIAAAMGLVAAARQRLHAGPLSLNWVEGAVEQLGQARPTAVNLRWALERMLRTAHEAFGRGETPAAVVDALRREADEIWREDAEMCRAIGNAGAALIPSGARVMTHCNAGALATGGIGTALGVIRVAHEEGKGILAIACEARPLNQGARLTAWELSQAGIPCRAIVDSAAAAMMGQGEVDLVIVGADRIAANGDVANKIGTYGLAIAARRHDLPFYVAAPRSTIDLATASGADIPIEMRPAAELATAPGVEVCNPAFDVTPAELVSAIVTDRGVVQPPYREGLSRLFD